MQAVFSDPDAQELTGIKDKIARLEVAEKNSTRKSVRLAEVDSLIVKQEGIIQALDSDIATARSRLELLLGKKTAQQETYNKLLEERDAINVLVLEEAGGVTPGMVAESMGRSSTIIEQMLRAHQEGRIVINQTAEGTAAFDFGLACTALRREVDAWVGPAAALPGVGSGSGGTDGGTAAIADAAVTDMGVDAEGLNTGEGGPQGAPPSG